MAVDVRRFAYVSLPVEVDALDDAGQMMREKIIIKFQPATPAKRAEWRVMAEAAEKAQSEDEQAEILVELLMAFLTGWDLTSDGQPFPLTKDSLKSLPYTILAPIWNAVESYHSKKNPT